MDNDKEMYKDPNERELLPEESKPKVGMKMKFIKGTVSIQVVDNGKWYDWKYGTRHPDFKKARAFALECYKRDMKGSKE